MKIVLKPGGLFLLLGAFVGILVISLKGNGGVTAPTPEATIPVVTSKPAATPEKKSPTTLQNPGFESDYKPVVPYDNKAQLSGNVAAPWVDDSSWAKVHVSYAEDRNNPHSGETCQKIQIDSVERVKPEDRDVVQFSQQLALPSGKAYHGEVWLRADKPTEVEFAIRQQKWPYQYYGAKVSKVGTEWTKVTVDGTIAQEGDTFLMMKFWKNVPLTVWCDDVSLVPAK